MSISDTHEPEPVHNSNPAVWDKIIELIKQRDQMGLNKYGTRLQPFNERYSIVDLFQELMDGIAYCYQLMYELEYIWETITTIRSILEGKDCLNKDDVDGMTKVFDEILKYGYVLHKENKE